MIERIFIPTVHRVDQQITFNHLPAELKGRVTMVVQAWERDQYHYDCDYLVLPDTEEYHFSDYYCLPRTRKVIYEAGQDMKYAVLDDDLRFKRRNAKYWSGVSDMDISKRFATDSEVLEMFDLYDRWLDELALRDGFLDLREVGVSRLERQLLLEKAQKRDVLRGISQDDFERLIWWDRVVAKVGRGSPQDAFIAGFVGH